MRGLSQGWRVRGLEFRCCGYRCHMSGQFTNHTMISWLHIKQLSGDILSLLLVPLLPLSPDCFVLSCAVSSPIVHVSWRTSRYSSISLETLACLEERLLTWAFTSIACYLSLSGFAGWLSVVAFASIAFLLLCMAFVICYCFLRQCNVTNHISM